ncbi:hypothetical protein Arub01_30460 [Actinomadura rubrobrunea]|uniref:Uncharacterized protein n=1 Tax=Actinomadura rubrobrunea TaxID=115335 RepID=A0A9W6UX14_9ACTN|nr:DUF6882 domain-containing protein [Actinomadura rubrobrunea]GLW64802.1 hypothetical protein Arub01_30460 [Actinomadura rubrobrunea]
MSGTLTLANVLDDAALLSLEHQLRLEEVVGRHNWHMDLREGLFEFTGSRNLRCTRVHLLGSAAPGPQSWLWAWANPTGYSESLTAASVKVREFGQQYGIPELASAEIPFTAVPGGPADFRLEPARVASTLLDAAKVVSGVWTSYHADVGRGTRAAFLLEHPEFQLPPPAFPRVMRILQQGLAEMPLRDQRRAIHSYARLRQLGAAFNHDYTELSITGPGFGIQVSFDPQGRVSNMSATTTPA